MHSFQFFYYLYYIPLSARLVHHLHLFSIWDIFLLRFITVYKYYNGFLLALVFLSYDSLMDKVLWSELGWQPETSAKAGKDSLGRLQVQAELRM